MPIFRFKPYSPGSGANSDAFFSSFYGNLLTNTVMSSTSMRGSPVAGERAAILGSNLVYTNAMGPVRPSAGKIDSLSVTHLGLTIMSVTGLKENGLPFGAAFLSGPSALADYLSRGNDRMFGSAESDTLYAGKGNDLILGDDGNDQLYGEEGKDTLNGGEGNDTLDSGTGGGTMIGGNGDDYVYGGSAAESAFGGNGDDYFNGYGGKDVLTGAAGGDTLYGGDSADQLFGGTDDDYMYGGDGNDKITGASGSDTLGGDDGDDRLDGGAGQDTLCGGNGDDTMIGGSGNDYLYGDDDNDLLFGGTGTDTLYGSSGVDQFVFNTALGATNVDNVEDFEINLDKIVLDDDIFAAAGPVGALAVARFKIGAAATDATDRIIYNSVTGELFYDKDGTGGAAQVKFANIDTGLLLDAGDFSIIG
jgi:Ca2+-binding RTX toxin-like protein